MRDRQKAAKDIQNIGAIDIEKHLTEGKYTKAELLEIAAILGYKMPSGRSKDNIIVMLAKNLGFKDLTQRIHERPAAHGGTREGAGRKPLPEEDKRQVRSFKVTEEEWHEIQNRAKAAGMSTSEYIRKCTISKAGA